MTTPSNWKVPLGGEILKTFETVFIGYLIIDNKPRAMTWDRSTGKTNLTRHSGNTSSPIPEYDLIKKESFLSQLLKG